MKKFGFKSYSKILDDIDKEETKNRYNPLTSFKKDIVKEFPQWLRSLVMRIQFTNFLLILGVLYLLIGFVYPVLIQAGYADACESQGLVYFAPSNVCVEESVVVNPILFKNFVDSQEVKSRFKILRMTLFPLSKFSERSARVHRLSLERSADLLMNPVKRTDLYPDVWWPILNKTNVVE